MVYIRELFFVTQLINYIWCALLPSSVTRDRSVYPRKYRVLLGNHRHYFNESSEQLFDVRRVILHPQWDRPNLRNDIALLEVEGVIQFTTEVQPVCLAARDFPDNYQCVITGWGDTRGDERENIGYQFVRFTFLLRYSKLACQCLV